MNYWRIWGQNYSGLKAKFLDPVILLLVNFSAVNGEFRIDSHLRVETPLVCKQTSRTCVGF